MHNHCGRRDQGQSCVLIRYVACLRVARETVAMTYRRNKYELCAVVGHHRSIDPLRREREKREDDRYFLPLRGTEPARQSSQTVQYRLTKTTRSGTFAATLSSRLNQNDSLYGTQMRHLHELVNRMQRMMWDCCLIFSRDISDTIFNMKSEVLIRSIC
jgi:hypothetical protein